MITLKIEGVNELINDLNNAPKVIQDNINDAIGKSVRLIKQNVQREAPVFDGTLKKSITTKTKNMEGEVGVDSSAENYGYVIEYGRRPGSRMPPYKKLERWAQVKMGDSRLAFPLARAIGRRGTKPRPFFQDGFDNSKRTVEKFLENAGVKIVEQI